MIRLLGPLLLATSIGGGSLTLGAIGQPAGGGGGAASVVLPAPSAHYAFESDLTDTLGNWSTGTGTNVSYVAGVSGNALSFSGGTSNREVTIPSQAGEDWIDGAQTEYSVELWINPNNSGEGGGARLFDKRPATTNNLGPVCNLAAESNDKVRLDCTWSSWSVQNPISRSSVTIPTDAWSHIVITFGDNDEFVLYRNGREFTDSGLVTSGTGPPGNDDTVDYVIGNSQDDNREFDGEIDELYFYADKQLTAQEVRDIYNARPKP